MKDIITNFHFIRPIWLLLLPVVVVIWTLWQRRSDPLRGWREQIAPELLNALAIGRETIKRGPAMTLLALWLIAVIAIAGPTWRLEPSPFADDATPLMILLKADASMETPDPAPSRLERARLKIADLAEARQGQPLGLIAYAGSAHLVLPPTRDTPIVSQMAAEISPEIMPMQGDRLDLALRAAEKVLSQGGKGGTILILADSVETAPATLSGITDFPIAFLSINRPGSAQDDSLRAAAKTLRAKVQPLSIEDEDISALVHLAARPPVAQSGEQGAHWQEAGYWLTPLIALLLLSTFRRETRSQEVPA
jgi:Ca-activated chloride channel family protein